MGDNVIREFLVGLGFKVDDKSQKKFNEGLEFANAKAVAFGMAMYDVAKIVAESVVKMASDFDQLYWRSQRLGSSATEIKAFSYAMTQLGGSSQGAANAMESIAEFVKSSPGNVDFLLQWGVSPEHIGNAKKSLQDLGETFKKLDYWTAKSIAGAIGIDPLTLQAMLKDTGEFEKWYAEMAERIGKLFGVNLDDASGAAKEFATNLRMLKAEAELAFNLALYKVLDWLLPRLEALAKWVEDILSGKKLSGVGGEFQKIAKDVMLLLDALGELAGTPYMQNFADKMLSALDHVIKGLTGLVKLINDVVNGNWAAAWNDVKGIVWQGSGVLDDVTDAVVGYGQDKYNRDPVGDPNNLIPDWMHGGANDNEVGGSGGGRRGGGGTTKAQQAEALLMKYGFPAPAAKGLVAVLHAESGLNEHRWNEAGSGAYGLAQWLTKSRVAEFARKFGHSIYGSSFEEQIAFVAHELRTTYKGVGDRIRNMTDPLRVSGYVIDHFEAPGPEGALGDMRRVRQFLGVTGSGRSATVNQTNNYSIASNHDPKAIANEIAATQHDINQRLVANFGLIVQ